MIGISNTVTLAKLAEHLLPLRAIRLAADLPHFSLIGIGTRPLCINAVMPGYTTAITAAVALSRRHWLFPSSTVRRRAASARRSRGPLHLVWSRPSL